MFEQVLEGAGPDPDTPADETWPDPDWFDPAWLDQAPAPEEIGQIPAAQSTPSGWLALELDHATADPARLPDADLIDTIVGYERVSAWAGARQARLLAAFARRRRADYSRPTRSDNPSLLSDYAPDEIALALRLSRTTATTRMVMATTLATDLPATLGAWQAGTIDARKAAAITEASYLLAPEQRGALEARVLPRAGTQTLPRLRAALARAVLALDPDGAAARHAQRRHDRRVVLSPEDDGMASLWALLSAPDATAAYHHLGDLARNLGADDPRSMDARRADLLVALLTGHPCPPPHHSDSDSDSDATSTGHDDPDTPTASNPTHPTTTPSTGHPSTGHCRTGPGQPGHPPHHRTPGPQDRTTPRRPATRPGKPLISVVVPITTLMGLDDQPGELIGYGPIPAPLAREIAADGTWRRLLTDPATGTLLDYGRTTYTPPAGLADFVRARDLYCRNPICGQRARTADLDHTIPWDAGGTTSATNLHAACRHDHLVKTFTPGWQVDQHPDATLTITTPTGHTYPSHPHDYRPDPHPPPSTPTGHDPPDNDEPPF